MQKQIHHLKVAVTICLVFLSLGIFAQSVHPKLALVHKQYYLRFPKTISFTQQTEIYRADTVFRRQTWYEAGQFPNLFRIDFGHPREGNAVIFRGDSTYNFSKGKLMKPSISPNILIYLLGGMYFEPLEQVSQKLTKKGFDVSKGYSATWKGRAVDIVGVSTPDSTKSQLWFDAKEHYLVRMVEQRDISRLECQFEGHQKTDKVWHETFVKIYSNNKLVQTEAYSNFRTNVTLQPSFFDPNSYGTWHWLKD